MWPAIDSAYYGLITPTTLTANRTYTLPNKTGTVALTSDLPDDANTTSSTAYPIYMGADSTAGDVTTINMSTGRLLFNPGARKFTIMSAGSTSDVFTFGITKVASW